MLKWGIEGGKVLQGAMEQAVKDWAESLARPKKDLGSLFPGMIKGGGDRGEEDDEEMDL